MSTHARTSTARVPAAGSKARVKMARAGDDWAWLHISAAQHAGAMRLQQAAGNAFVAQTMGSSTRGGSVPAAPAMADEEEPIQTENAPPEETIETSTPEEEPVEISAELPEEEEAMPAAQPPEEEEELPAAPMFDQEEAAQVATQESNEQSEVQGTPEEAKMEEEFQSEQGGEHNDENLPIKEQIEEDPEELEEEEDTGASMVAAPMPKFSFHDAGMVGTGPVGDYKVDDNDARPRAYSDGGMTGTIAWAGGGGAGPHGNENVGSIQTEQAPAYISTQSGSNPANAYADGGVTDVTRSYVGATSGDQGNGFWVSSRAAARLNQHEQKHIDSTRKHYNEHLLPLQIRIALSPILGRQIAPDTTSGIAAIKAQVRWAASIAAFQAGDNADNYPMNTVDTADLASGTYPVHAGPGRAQGKRYTQRLKMPDETIPRR